MYTNGKIARPSTIERIQEIIKDIIWIGINNNETHLSMPVKFLINRILADGTKGLAARMAIATRGATMLTSGLTLHWQHNFDDKLGYTKISFAIGGSDVHDMGYTDFVESAQDYFKHLDQTGSRTF